MKIPPGGGFIINEELVRLPIKYIPNNFKGREMNIYEPRMEEMSKLRSCFLERRLLYPSLPGHCSFLITGLGGAGKTELVFRFLEESSGSFEAIFVVVADTESRVSAQFSDLALHLGLLSSSENANQELCSEVFRAWLGNPIRGAPDPFVPKSLVKWLLVFDNAESSEVVKKFWPGGDHGNILVTSRNPLLAAPELYFKGKTHLGGLAPKAAAHLLRLLAEDNNVGDENTEADARELVSWVQGLPMAIERMGRMIRNDELSISQFHRLYPNKDRLRPRLYGVDGDGSTFITAWALEALQKDQQDTFDLLCLIAMLDPEEIEEGLLEPRPTSLNADGSRMEKSDYIFSRKQLSMKSLIMVNRVDQTVSVHRVVQDVATLMAINGGCATTIFREVLTRIASRWPFLNRNYITGSATQVSRWDQCRRVYNHILRLFEVHGELSAASVGGLPSLELAELLLEAVQ